MYTYFDATLSSINWHKNRINKGLKEHECFIINTSKSALAVCTRLKITQNSISINISP